MDEDVEESSSSQEIPDLRLLDSSFPLFDGLVVELRWRYFRMPPVIAARANTTDFDLT